MPKFNILINTPGCLCINHIEVSPSPEITNAVKLVQLYVYVNILINTPSCLCINPIDVVLLQRLAMLQNWYITKLNDILLVTIGIKNQKNCVYYEIKVYDKNLVKTNICNYGMTLAVLQEFQLQATETCYAIYSS